MWEGLESGQLTQERLDEAVLRVLAFKAMLRLHEKQRTNALMPAEEGLSVIGCPEHRACLLYTSIPSNVRKILCVSGNRGRYSR